MTDDFVRVNRSATPALSYAWERLWRRVDPIVLEAGLEPMVVFDNVPWGFTAGGGDTDDATGTYGNVRGPDDAEALQLYATFAENVTGALAQRYGRLKAASWQYRC